ncbi:hypothetical protein HPB51_018316 [Rhipicephalus microplus]|uniref:Uncharacterized protein n=1 Tax=Rhipicephalus microplus TaxID=6941 RepID=A0A9J6DBL2_RHIMP|nr:hypothetical protein HPB51_018316 [Rhipicephalus microplus]
MNGRLVGIPCDQDADVGGVCIGAVCIGTLDCGYGCGGLGAGAHGSLGWSSETLAFVPKEEARRIESYRLLVGQGWKKVHEEVEEEEQQRSDYLALRERPRVGETYAATLRHQWLQRERGEQEGSAQRPVYSAKPVRLQRKRQVVYDQLRPTYRCHRHLLQRQFRRLRRERVFVGEAIAARRLFRRGRNIFEHQVSSAQADMRPMKTQWKRKEDNERLPSDYRLRPFLLRHRLSRLPGEHPEVEETSAMILLLWRDQHFRGKTGEPTVCPRTLQSPKDKQKKRGPLQVVATVEKVPSRCFDPSFAVQQPVRLRKGASCSSWKAMAYLERSRK